MDEDDRLWMITTNAIDIIGRASDEDCDKKTSMLHNYVRQALQIKLNSCPKDFASAFVATVMGNEYSCVGAAGVATDVKPARRLMVSVTIGLIILLFILLGY